MEKEQKACCERVRVLLRVRRAWEVDKSVATMGRGVMMDLL